jgi:hypothetical protein
MAQEPEDLSGYRIHASDGEIGHVARHDVTTAVGYLLVATGHWISGRTVLLPGSVVERIDHAGQAVYVTCSKEQIREAPEFRDDESHRGELLDYYRLMPRGPAGRI